jgi:hypothetical protein
MLVITGLLFIANSCGQVTKRQIKNSTTENSIVLQKENLQECKEKEYQELPKLESIDLTKLLKEELSFDGMIGKDVQRMGIVFLSIVRINKTEYEVIGKSKVKNNICDFKGIIEAQSVITSDIDSGYSETSTVDGRVTGKYLFYEDKSQSGTGTFEGTFVIYWAYYDSIIDIADLWYTASDYTILFDGTWKSYQTGNIKNACWSDYKGCFPDDFNRSDGPDLIPDEKYRSSGWGPEIDLWSFDKEKEEKAAKELSEKWRNWWK